MKRSLKLTSITFLLILGLLLLNLYPSGARAEFWDDWFEQGNITANYSDDCDANSIVLAKSPQVARVVDMFYPNESYIKSIIRFKYSELEECYYYILEYSITVTFLVTRNTTVTIPLAPGTVERIYLSHNDEVLKDLDIRGHNIHLTLTNDTYKHTLSLRYVAEGAKSYKHNAPLEVYLKYYQMELIIYDSPFDLKLTSNCLRPNVYESRRNYTRCFWDKESAVLTKYIQIRFLDSTDEDDGFLAEFFMVCGILVVIVTILVAVAIILNKRSKQRKKGRKKGKKSKLKEVE